MEFEQITTEVSGHILTITLNRPERLNAWTARMGKELIEALDRADCDDDVRAVVVTGAGRAFCAGADLTAGGETFKRIGQETLSAAPGDTAVADATSDIPRDNGGLFTLRAFDSSKPIIAAINGAAVGVGATMTLPMDIRLAAENARFGFVFTRRGIVPEACSTWFLPRIVGIPTAMEWVATGRMLSARDALAAGLVRSLHRPEQLLEAAHALAAEIAENAAPVSVALARRMMWTMLGAEHPMAAHRAESRAMLARSHSPDVTEGVNAFFEKRSPRFTDRVSTGLPDILAGRQTPRFE